MIIFCHWSGVIVLIVRCTNTTSKENIWHLWSEFFPYLRYIERKNCNILPDYDHSDSRMDEKWRFLPIPAV